jgi:adenylate cyclase
LQRASRKPPASLDAWAAYQRGLWHNSKASAEDNALAEEFFQRAIDLDPSFAGGYRGLAVALRDAATIFQRRDLPEAQAASEALAWRSFALDSNDAEARVHFAGALLWRGDHQAALAEAERAINMTPNLASAHGVFGAALIFAGRPKDGLAALETCLRLDPCPPFLASCLLWITVGLYFTGDYEAAVDAAKRAIRWYPDLPLTYRWLAAALAWLGRADEAKEALATAVAVSASQFDIYVRSRAPWMRPEDHAHMLEGLRKAGWREDLTPRTG